MKKKVLIALLLVMALFVTTVPAFAASLEEVNVEEPVKNIIMLIPDGMPIDAVTFTRWYRNNEPLVMDSIVTGLVRTYSADAVIADSAPAGTAMATGYKSRTGHVGVLAPENTIPGLEPLAEGDALKPVANLCELARLAGKSTGVIATSELMHATPADFSAHDASRKNYDGLSEQQVFSQVDVFLGGGTIFYQPEGREDGKDIYAIMNERYNVVHSPSELETVTEGPLFGLFAETAMDYDFDRNPEEQPSLAEMTTKAIEILSQNENGFFLMVEGSKIDWASHPNEVVGQISDILAFDAAVEVALNFAKEDGNTIVIAATDHGNSGMSIGNHNTSSGYDKLPLDAFINDTILNAKNTAEGIEKLLNEDRSNVKEVMAEYYGIENLSDMEIKAIEKCEEGGLQGLIGPMMAERVNVGYTTTGHTGGDVTLYCYAPENVDVLSGLVENSDIGKYCAKAFGLSLDEANEKLFVRAAEAFEAAGATIEMNEEGEDGLTFTITKDDQELVLVANRSVAKFNGEDVQLQGLVIYSGEQLYVSQDAVDMIAGEAEVAEEEVVEEEASEEVAEETTAA